MLEEFRDISNFEGMYQVSNLGNVKSLLRNGLDGRIINERILSAAKGSDGYLFIVLYKDGKKKCYRIHQLVAETFNGHKRENGLEVSHIDKNKINNRNDNLEILSIRKHRVKDISRGLSIYVGVHWNKNEQKWQSRIYFNKKRKHLGYFKNEIDAHNAYQKELQTL